MCDIVVALRFKDKDGENKMVWFDSSLRFPLCETGIDAKKDIPPIKVTITGINGLVQK